MGYCKLAGRLSEEEKFGSKIGRVDVPTGPNEFRIHYFTAASIYRITIVTEEMVRREIAVPKQLEFDYVEDLDEYGAGLRAKGQDKNVDEPPYFSR